jgi:hypothetical protein
VRRLRRYNNALYRDGAEVEVFWEMPPEAYTRFMTLPDAAGVARFYGVRPRALSDPLTYLRGWRTRQAIGIAINGKVS